jgi:membrane-bound serine protease (ClpP class)
MLSFMAPHAANRRALRRNRPGAVAALVAWFVVLYWLCTLAASIDRAISQSANPAPVVLIDIKGAIGFVAAGRLAKAVEHASALGSPAVIVRIDTPGGLLSSTREMIHTILASRIPIIMYVAPDGSRAASAGTYLMYASHVAAMAPGTHLGAATPISLSPSGLPGSPPKTPPSSDKQPEPDPATAAARKGVNDAVAYMRTLAELRGRNADWGEKAVREAATLTAGAALKERVADVVASNVDDLLSQIDGRSVNTAAGEVRLATKGRNVAELKADWKMQALSAISDPNIALILLMIGIYGILFEFWSPGTVVPGVIGGICLIVALTSLSILPVNLGGLALLLLGIALMAAEAFSPGFGILGLGGLAAFAVGALFLFDPAQSDVPIAVSWPVVAGMAALSAAFFAGVLGFAVRARHRPVRIGAEQMIGSTGLVVRWTEGTGSVLIDGEMWEARSSRPLSRGQTVRVVSRAGLVLTIEAAT